MKKYVKIILKALFSKFAKGHKNQIAEAQKWIDSAQNLFANALEEAEIAEQKFDTVAGDILMKAKELENQLSEIEKKRSSATKFKNKLQEFVD